MSEEKSKELFTPEFIKTIRRARELNNDKRISGDIYFHPTEKHIVVKSIDLGMRNPLCEVNSRPGTSSKEAKKQDWEERWLEAYLIRKAKRNNWTLELADKQYWLLYSQLRFRGKQGMQGGEHRLLDLLLYDEHDKNLVILELKSKRDLKKAREELDTYNRRIAECKGGLIEAFNLDKSVGIVGYIVWPASDREGEWSQDLDKFLGNYGLIEYTKTALKPWEAFNEARKQGEDLEIKFACRKPTG